jgi:hypothetical protein
VVLAALGLVAGQLGWTAALLARSYFRQGDFLLLDRALHEGFGWGYLMSVPSGHLMPAGMAVTWGLARISLYNWFLASAVIMVLVAAASLAMLRMLLTLFGSRPGILGPFAVYLFGPLSAGAVAWLSVALRVLPLETAMFMAIDAHVRYLRGGRRPPLIAAAVWLAVGMAAADQGALVPLLLFALTVAFFTPGRLRDAAERAAVRYWRAWAVYGTLLAAYCVVFFIQLAGSGVPVPGPGQASSLYRFAGTLIGTAALPGFLGGPWQWGAAGYAQAAPPAGLEFLSWIVVAVVVLASSFLRPGAWRAWAILLGWIVAADIVPVALHGFGTSVTAIGEQTGYLANATGVLALCLGLALLPAGESTRAAPRPLRAVAVFALCCFAAGTIASQQAFDSLAVGNTARSYLATARAALADAPSGTLVVDGPTPPTVMDPEFFGGQADAARVIGPARDRTRAAWTSGLDGVYANPMTFDAKGRLRPVVVTGLWSWPPPEKRGAPACFTVTGSAMTIPLTGTLYRWQWIARVAYQGPAGRLGIRLGTNGTNGTNGTTGSAGTTGTGSVVLPPGRHVAFIPLTGDGNVVSVRFQAARPLCVTAITVGLLSPDQSGRAIPPAPVHG